MKWAVIILIMLSLVGSMMWAMPSPRQRFQAELRSRAKPLGFQVQMVRLTAPRGKGEAEAEQYSVMAYRLPRLNMDKKSGQAFESWHAFRVESIANEGLPAGWSWGFGENVLSEAALTLLADIIAKMPEGVSSIESTPIHVSAHWNEKGKIEDLDLIQAQLARILEAKV
ncbi:MAG: hypothetical protein ACPGF7_07935 [Pontibacterium sp.]